MSADRRRAVAALAAAAATLAVPQAASAHAIDGAFQLPVPLWLYLLGAAVAVAASFVVTVAASRRASGPDYATTPFPATLAAVLRVALRVLGLLWWYGAIVVGFVVADISPLPAVLLWIGIWVALPIVAAVIGNPWPSLSPFRTTFAALDWVARRLGAQRLDAGLPYPPSLARWPAVALLAAGVWCELILPGSERCDHGGGADGGLHRAGPGRHGAVRPRRLAPARRAVRGAARLVRAHRPGREALRQRRTMRGLRGRVRPGSVHRLPRVRDRRRRR